MVEVPASDVATVTGVLKVGEGIVGLVLDTAEEVWVEPRDVIVPVVVDVPKPVNVLITIEVDGCGLIVPTRY